MRWQLLVVALLALAINVLNVVGVEWPWLLVLLGVQVGIGISMLVDMRRGIDA